MSSNESFDEIRIDFDDEDSLLSDNYISPRIPDQGRGGTPSVKSMPHSVTYPSIISTGRNGSTTGLDCGPNQNTTSVASNWVLGVRHLSFASNSLNERMSERGKYLSNVSNNSNVKSFRNKSFNCTQKRETKLSLKYPMNDIQEDCAESFDSYRSNQINNNVIHNKNAFNIMEEKVTSHRLSDPNTKTGLKSYKQRSGKCISQPNLHNQNVCPKTTDKTNEFSANSSEIKMIPEIDYPNDDKPLNNNNYFSKKTKNCDFRVKICETNDKLNEENSIVNINLTDTKESRYV